MDRKHKIEIVVALIIILALIILIWFLLKKPTEEVVIEQQTTETTDDIPLSQIETTQLQQPDDADTVSRVFVERLGSFSNEGGFTNLDVIKELSTQSLKNSLNTIAEDALDESDDAYYGISTIVITIKEISLLDSAATYRLTTQRKESIGSPGNSTVRYQDITVDLVNIDGTWLVDDFEWE